MRLGPEALLETTTHPAEHTAAPQRPSGEPAPRATVSVPEVIGAASTARILLADGERQFRRMERRLFERAGYTVRDVASGRDAIDEYRRFRPDVVVTDAVLPDMSGVDVCREIREKHQEPIIVLSAVADEETKIAALDAGADDYVLKPIGTGELLARIRVALRRGASSRAQAPIVAAGALRIDLEHHSVEVDNHPVHLTPTEFSLLRHLAVNRGKIVTHPMIVAAVWGEPHADDGQLLRTYINQLRSKLGAARTAIQTEPGIGYRFVAAPNS